VRNGAYQIFEWGWVADYPDPENFLFLLTCELGASQHGGPNTANFCDARYDALFQRMRVREDDGERLRVIREMRALLEEERPWIELFHPEVYALYHGWLAPVKPFGMSYPTAKYQDLDPARRAARRAAWNRPVRWPAWALLATAVAVVLPGVRTFLRERQ
jgi:ABC-type oligopeptide transport system substrate-binding subunit